jgi:hypothetical protein
MLLVGEMLSVAHAQCCSAAARAALLPHVVRLAAAALMSCAIVGDGDTRAASAPDSPPRTPCLAEAPPCAYLTELLQATFCMLGHQCSADSAPRDTVDLTTNSGWLFAGLGSLPPQVCTCYCAFVVTATRRALLHACHLADCCTQVAEEARTTLEDQMKAYIKQVDQTANGDDALVRRKNGCKLLLKCIATAA